MLALLFALSLLDSFDQPLDPLRWYVGTPGEPKGGSLRLPREGWIVARETAGEPPRRLEIDVGPGGGDLEIAFFQAREPLSSPEGEPFVLKASRSGPRTLVVEAGAEGPAAWDRAPGSVFRLRALSGTVELLEVRRDPEAPAPAPSPAAARRTVLRATTPAVFTEGDAHFVRAELLLWDVEVALLFRRGPPRATPLLAPPKGSPVLAFLLAVDDGSALAAKAGAHALAMRDWNDERGNLPPAEYARYLAGEYALFDLLLGVQRALNAVLTPRKGLEALPHLAVIRHADNVQAAVALAETQGAKEALAALRKAAGDQADFARMSGDALRAAAAGAAREILGEPPPEWPGFRFDPESRFVALVRARDLLR
ncbi:MAG: hypothetical protein ACT4PV_07765 [Planctomycetaceae bacterium]